MRLFALVAALVTLHLTTHHNHKVHPINTPNLGAVTYWSHKELGKDWGMGVCIAKIESAWELSPPVNGASWGPWQIDKAAHPWLNIYLVTHSWRYAAYALRRVAWHPPKNGYPGYFSFSPWHPDCGA